MPKIESLMGKMIEVEIVECTKFSMKGKLSEEDIIKYTAMASKQVKTINSNVTRVNVRSTKSIIIKIFNCFLILY